MALPFLVNIPFLFHNLFLFQKDFFKKTVRLGALSWDREKWQKIARFTAEPWELEGLTLVPSTSWWNLRNTIIRMGGFHIALNYLALLGKKNAPAGLADLLIESGVCAGGTTSVLMLGKSYNRGIRAHKLSMETLFRLLWQAFLEWLSKQDNDLDNWTKHVVVNRSSNCRTTLKTKEFSKDG